MKKALAATSTLLLGLYFLAHWGVPDKLFAFKAAKAYLSSRTPHLVRDQDHAFIVKREGSRELIADLREDPPKGRLGDGFGVHWSIAPFKTARLSTYCPHEDTTCTPASAREAFLRHVSSRK